MPGPAMMSASGPMMTTSGQKKPAERNEHRRHRITFGTSRSLAYVSVLELGLIWERSLRRAQVPLKYSQGYNPRPRMHFAAPLPVGCGSEADLLDVELTEGRSSVAIARALDGKMPVDLVLVEVTPVSDGAPALSEQLVETEYRVWIKGVGRAGLKEAVDAFLAQDTVDLPKRGRRHRGKTYNLRPLVKALSIDAETPSPWEGLQMRLNARPGATGRPDEVLKALGLEEVPRRCFRTRMLLDTSLGT
ncbi:MAG: TIGR03936 family radical SAM-associated protein [Anaerolineae bacterium]